MRKYAYFFGSMIIGVFCLLFFSWISFPHWIADSLSKKMGVAVFIDRFKFTPRSVAVDRTVIGNPTDSILANALKIEALEAEAPLSRFFKRSIVLDAVNLSDVYLGLEFDSMLNSHGNWSVIMKNLTSSLKSEPSKKSKSLLIKHLTIKDLQIDLVFKQDNKGVRHLKPIALMEFKNVSGEGGALIDQFTNIVMGEILKEVFSMNNLKDMLNGILKPSNQNLSPLYNSIKSLFSQETGEEH